MLKAIIIAVVVGRPAALLYGSRRWRTRTQELRARLEAARVPLRPRAVDFRELEGLPAPVQRYLRAALKEGRPLVSAVSVEHTGTFNLSERGEQWRPFTSTQRVVTQRPGFVWDGRITMLPGIAVRVHDAYVAGEGILHPALFGLVTLADMRDTGGDVARGELMRFFAEAAWYPTALLPSQGVRWESLDNHSAKATLIDGALSQGGAFGGAVAVPRLHRSDHVGPNSQQGGATHQDRGQEQAVLRSEPSGHAAHQTEQEECSHAGKPRARARGVPRPLPLRTDGKPYQPRYGKSQRRIEIRRRRLRCRRNSSQHQAPRAHWADTSPGPRTGCAAA